MFPYLRTVLSALLLQQVGLKITIATLAKGMNEELSFTAYAIFYLYVRIETMSLTCVLNLFCLR